MKLSLRSLFIFLIIVVVGVVGFKAEAAKKKRIANGRSTIAADPPSCSTPGTLVVSDPTGDQTGAPAANQQFDIQSISIAEPCLADGINRLTFTMKVANLSSVPAN